MTSDGSGSSAWAKARRVATAQAGISRLQAKNRNIRASNMSCKQGLFPGQKREASSL